MAELMIDTGLLIALVNPRDRHHGRAREIHGAILDGRWTRVHTTEHVLVKAYNFVRQRLPTGDKARELSTLIWGDGQAAGLAERLHPVTRAHLNESLRRYHERFDQGLSLTDWTTVVCMEDQDIEELASFDTGFDGLVPRIG